MEFNISMGDIRKYLESLQPDQPVGQVQNPQACLVEKALEYKYPGTHFRVDLKCARPINKPGDIFELLQDVQDVVAEFDNMAEIDMEAGLEFPTRIQVEEAIPQLRLEGEN